MSGIDLTDIVPSQEVADELFPPDVIGPTWQKNPDGTWMLPEHTLGWEILGWVADWLTFPDETPWIATPEQARFILWFYAIDENGRFVYRKAVLQRMKGWGKDPLAAVLSFVELVGPSQFAGWAPGGQPIGKPHPEAHVQVTAVSVDQNANTTDFFPGMVPKRTIAEFQLEMHKEIVYAHGGKQKLKAVAANHKTAEGNRVTFSILNETHWWSTSTGGHKFYATLMNNMTKVAGRAICITNAYNPADDSVAQRIREEQEKVWAGLTRASGWLYDSLEAHPDAPLTVEWAPFIVKQIRGDAVWLNAENITEAMQDGSIPPSNKRRMWYNQIVASEDALYSASDWDGALAPDCYGDKRDLKPNDEIVLGFDGGKTDDATALVAIRLSDKLIVPLAVWQDPNPPGRRHKPSDPNSPPPWRVDQQQVDSEVKLAFSSYRVRAFFADTAEWQSYINTWADDYREQLLVKATSFSAVGFDMRSDKATVARTHEALMQSIIDRTIHHNGSKVLRLHALAAYTAHNGFGVTFRKEKPDSDHKVDCYAATHMAFMALTKLLESGKEAPPERTRRLHQF